MFLFVDGDEMFCFYFVDGVSGVTFLVLLVLCWILIYMGTDFGV